MEKHLKENNRTTDNDHEILNQCPWCFSEKYEKWGEENVRGFESVICADCNLIFIKNRLSKIGLDKFYSNYLTDVHQVDKKLNVQRGKMYNLEFNLVNQFSNKYSKVLDVGCSGGYFLDIFKENGYKCYGFEIGQAAAEQAKQKHKVWVDSFLDIEFGFDLIIFRGVIEHLPYPKKYLDKAVSLLNDKGLIYITSTPNSNSLCCNLFKEQWNQHSPEAHLMHFNPSHFDAYFSQNGFRKITDFFFYEETPYAEIEEDILKIAKAIELKRNNLKINFQSPPFYRNMMSVIYKKENLR